MVIGFAIVSDKGGRGISDRNTGPISSIPHALDAVRTPHTLRHVRNITRPCSVPKTNQISS